MGNDRNEHQDQSSAEVSCRLMDVCQVSKKELYETCLAYLRLGVLNPKVDERKALEILKTKVPSNPLDYFTIAGLEYFAGEIFK